MSNGQSRADWEPEGAPDDAPGDAVDITLVPRAADLGNGLTVHRALPAPERRMVGPFIFFDRIGPAVLKAGSGLDVRPHPQIGLATVTYLFTGEILHRDSLGFVQPICPGAVNWMTAGRGIVHSERTPPELRPVDAPLSGIQLWLALPKAHEETAPSFVHHGKDTLPVLDAEGKRVRLILGTLYGARSPVETLSETFYADVELAAGARLTLPAEHEERAMFVIDGAVEVTPGRARFEPGRMIVFRSGAAIRLTAIDRPARLVLLGGAPMDGPRHIWWNLVSSSRERIEQAKADWQNGRFRMVPGETEFIPLPEK
jgi:redox-sensitive bicupin YhaK (pirin superfamily)